MGLLHWYICVEPASISPPFLGCSLFTKGVQDLDQGAKCCFYRSRSVAFFESGSGMSVYSFPPVGGRWPYQPLKIVSQHFIGDAMISHDQPLAYMAHKPSTPKMAGVFRFSMVFPWFSGGFSNGFPLVPHLK